MVTIYYNQHFTFFDNWVVRDVYVVDLRLYGDSVSKLIDQNQIQDKLILYNLNILYSDMSIVKLE